MATELTMGVYPAAVTPFDESGAVDSASLARLVTYFDAAGCSGVVLAGTNGEGPSLSTFEKRDLVRTVQKVRNRLKVILGVATSSLTEAVWQANQAQKDGADAVLLMPPMYFRSASESGILRWLKEVVDSTSIPILIYNYPKMTGTTLSLAAIEELARHPRIVGFKDSSGDAHNLRNYRSRVSDDKVLFVGDETLLLQALEAGWTGTISGAANLVPQWLSRVMSHWHATDQAETRAAYQLISPVLSYIRSCPQPPANKHVLQQWGVIGTAQPRLPLEQFDASDLALKLKQDLGLGEGNLGIRADV